MKIEITNWESKFIPLQDKNSKDFDFAKAELIRVNKESIEGFLDKVFN